MRIFNRQTGINTPRRDATAAKASLPLFAGEGFAQILGMVGKSGFDFGPVVDGKFACLIKRLAAGEFFAMTDWAGLDLSDGAEATPQTLFAKKCKFRRAWIDQIARLGGFRFWRSPRNRVMAPDMSMFRQWRGRRNAPKKLCFVGNPRKVRPKGARKGVRQIEKRRNSVYAKHLRSKTARARMPRRSLLVDFNGLAEAKVTRFQGIRGGKSYTFSRD